MTWVFVSLSTENFSPTPNPLITTGFSFTVDSFATPLRKSTLLRADSVADDPSPVTLPFCSSTEFGSPVLALVTDCGGSPSLTIDVIFTLASVQPWERGDPSLPFTYLGQLFAEQR